MIAAGDMHLRWIFCSPRLHSCQAGLWHLQKSWSPFKSKKLQIMFLFLPTTRLLVINTV